ncbi:hypothetical protein V8G54_026297 [Vigna mungo]|uniref:Uncharacterized protein n=1 Tax=Vigna mungo TaxID=3915 RepID=A0AAQ3RPD1_VIGMU
MVVGSDAPSDYHVALRNDNPTLENGSTTQIPATTGSAPPIQPPHTTGMETSPATMSTKKKRGCPRKYAPDGSKMIQLPRNLRQNGVHNFFSSAESKAFVKNVELIGFAHQGSLGPTYGEAYRDDDRISVNDPVFANTIWT